MSELREIDIDCGEQSTRGMLVDLGPRTFLLRFCNCVVEGEFRDTNETCGNVKRLVLLEDGTGTAEVPGNSVRALTWKASALGPEARMEEIEIPHSFPLWEGCATATHDESKAEPDYKNPTLRGVVQRIDARFDIVEKHVRGIPAVQQELSDARKVPEHAALELFRRIQEILTPEQQRIWVAVRDARGVQKDALPGLKAEEIVNSEATLSRRVNEIDKKLKEHGLPLCKASGPIMRYRKSGGFTTAEGQDIPEEIAAISTDWTEDPDERKRIIRAFLLTDDGEERGFYVNTYPDIEAEANKYKKESGMKSD